MFDKDEIIEMARQAGFLYGVMGPSNARFVTAIGHTFTVELEAFAKLVAAKERKACADRAWIALVKHKQPWDVRQDVTEAIRARGEA